MSIYQRLEVLEESPSLPRTKSGFWVFPMSIDNSNTMRAAGEVHTKIAGGWMLISLRWSLYLVDHPTW